MSLDGRRAAFMVASRARSSRGVGPLAGGAGTKDDSARSCHVQAVVGTPMRCRVHRLSAGRAGALGGRISGRSIRCSAMQRDRGGGVRGGDTQRARGSGPQGSARPENLLTSRAGASMSARKRLGDGDRESNIFHSSLDPTDRRTPCPVWGMVWLDRQARGIGPVASQQWPSAEISTQSREEDPVYSVVVDGRSSNRAGGQALHTTQSA